MYHAKVLPKWFHLNGHTMRFHQRTQKLELQHVCIISLFQAFKLRGAAKRARGARVGAREDWESGSPRFFFLLHPIFLLRATNLAPGTG